jgi:hypothetical protein
LQSVTDAITMPGMPPDAAARHPVADPVMDALEQLCAVGRSNVSEWMLVMDRVEQVRRQRTTGADYREIELPEGTRLIDALAANHRRLTEATTLLRNVSILELHREGISTAEIARRFGVSRQWVSKLLGDLQAQSELTDKSPTNTPKQD